MGHSVTLRWMTRTTFFKRCNHRLKFSIFCQKRRHLHANRFRKKHKKNNTTQAGLAPGWTLISNSELLSYNFVNLINKKYYDVKVYFKRKN